jgi:signal peptidase I
MEPAFHRGDILFLVNPPNTRYEIGDITVYKIPGQDIPIVHRILETHDVVKVVNGSVFTRVTPSIVPDSPSALCAVFARPNLALKISCY